MTLTVYYFFILCIHVHRSLQIRLDQPVSDPASPREISNGEDTASNISSHIQVLRSEVMRLRNQLDSAEKESKCVFMIRCICYVTKV